MHFLHYYICHGRRVQGLWTEEDFAKNKHTWLSLYWFANCRSRRINHGEYTKQEFMILYDALFSPSSSPDYMTIWRLGLFNLKYCVRQANSLPLLSSSWKLHLHSFCCKSVWQQEMIAVAAKMELVDHPANEQNWAPPILKCYETDMNLNNYFSPLCSTVDLSRGQFKSWFIWSRIWWTAEVKSVVIIFSQF